MRYAILIFNTLLAFLVAAPVHAAISFSGGYWGTTFNCNEWTQPSALSCDGVEMDNDSAYAGGSQGSQITTDANYSGGAGGRGWRTYMVGNEHNGMSTPFQLTFPTAQKEVWLRFYYRIPSGQTVGSIQAHKIIYVWGSTTFRIDYPYYGNVQMEGDVNRIYPPGGDSVSNVSLGNWNALYGGAPNSAAADGSWHLFEFHIKVGTTSSDGAFQMWVDGINIINDVNRNMGTGAGITSIDIPNNHNVFQLSGNNPHDVDDVAVALPTYSGFVTNSTGFATGLQMIGPVGGGSPEPTCSDGIQNGDETGVDCGGSCSACSGSGSAIPTKGARIFYEPFENTSWSARGWWDDGSSGNAVVNAGGQSGNAVTWAWSQSAATPTGWGTMRNSFTASSEFLLEYYVRFATGWRGSGQDWHPHMIHVMSSADGDYSGMSSANSDLYFEAHTGTSSPYSIYPRAGHQDELRVNTNNGAVPNNLVSTTETRSANHCNTPYTLSGATAYDCYSHSGNYYSANWWIAPSITIPANTWTRITAYVKRNSFSGGAGNFDGIVKLWVGDQLAISSEQVLYAAGAYQSTTWNKVVLAPYIGDGSPISQTMYFDELAIYEVIESAPSCTDGVQNGDETGVDCGGSCSACAGGPVTQLRNGVLPVGVGTTSITIN